MKEQDVVDFLVSTGKYDPEQAREEARSIGPDGDYEYSVIADVRSPEDPETESDILLWHADGEYQATDNWEYDADGNPVPRNVSVSSMARWRPEDQEG